MNRRPTDAGTATLGEIVFAGRYGRAQVEAALHDAQAVGRVRTSGVWRAAGTVIMSQLAKAAEQLLASTAFELLSSGWRVHERLLEAARATAGRPGHTQTVELAAEDIEIADAIDVDITVDGNHLSTITVAVVITFHIGTLRANVQDGTLHSVRGSDCGFVVRLRIDDETLFEKLVPLDFTVAHTFDPAIVLRELR